MVYPFKIGIEQAILDDLRQRLVATRWPNEYDNAKWQAGTNKTYLRELTDYWVHSFDWRKQEAYLNSFPHFKSAIDDITVHFIHQKGEGTHSVPILLTHGYPDSFVRFLKVIPLLTMADEKGFSFDVVVPSIPGFGFSDIPDEPGMNPEKIAGLFAKLMHEELGYKRFIAHGGDWGSSITEQISTHHTKLLSGIHLTDVPFIHILKIPSGELSHAEEKFLDAGKMWQQTEGAYSMIQGTKPQSLAYGLNDSPAGLAGWIVEKFYSWSDNHGNIENSFTKDELLTNITIYWATQTANSAIRIYYETMKAIYNPINYINPFHKDSKKTDIPTAVAIFPKDIIPAPREFAERSFNIQQWTEMPRGGHFAAMEEPELLAADIRKFAILLNSNIVLGATD
ncbi:MAG: hypothetical protein JWO03_1668 [Bacteroidetes bacterium]|nr:hypothetical protein [Bacteroidota bacterium]